MTQPHCICIYSRASTHGHKHTDRHTSTEIKGERKEYYTVMRLAENNTTGWWYCAYSSVWLRDSVP